MKTILVVDDDHDLRVTLRAFFEAIGFRVLTAADGRAGLHALQRHRPDLLIVDLRLPVLDGWTLTRTARAEFPSLPIGIVSADADQAPREVDFVLPKPVNPEQLEEAVRSILSRPSAIDR